MHFQSGDIIWETSHFDEKTGKKVTARFSKPRLRSGAVPSLLPNCPSYLSSASHVRETPESKRARLDERHLQTAMADSIATHKLYKEEKSFKNIEDLVSNKLDFLDTSYWTVVKREGYVNICRILDPPEHHILLSLIINDDCSVRAFARGVEVKKLGDYKVPSQVNDIAQLELVLNKLKAVDIEQNSKDSLNVILVVLQLVISLLRNIRNEDSKFFSAITFICEQLHLMTLKRLEYSSEFVIFSSLLYNCSPQGYRLLRDSSYIILPSFSTIKRVLVSKNFSPSIEQHDENFLAYIKQKFKSLSPNDKTVNLLLDEIHLKAYLDYKGGSIVGSAFDSCAAATSAMVFMLNSITSTFKDVVHIIPTKCIKAETLHAIIRKVIVGLENIGFTVLVVITDNNSINSKAMSFFANPPKLSIVYPHPLHISRPLFFMFDSVHIFKCLRNNWFGQKDSNEKTMRFPKFSFTGRYYENNIEIYYAPLITLQKLYSLEAKSLLKHSYGLTQKALWPSNLEKQNVNLVLKIFNEYIIEALLSFGKENFLPFSAEVAHYIKVIHTWWTIMNVKSKFKGKRLNNPYATPLTNEDGDKKYEFLKNFDLWLQVWDDIKTGKGNLTRETFTAIKHTTQAMIGIAEYCISELKMDYILPGKFQTDNLEARFSKYRQMSGGNYNISVRQIFESEKKLRMISLLKKELSLDGKPVKLSQFDESKWDEMKPNVQENLAIDVNVVKRDFDECEEVLPIIVYLAGYCCYTVDKRLRCKFRKELTTENK
ncbi:uncharacterized protein LOC135225155 [Macrobrachium nipponense]|uniref:uncharacterized protein LOC135225155 n=1 Tax=Macrobrachium nipponense TaxID=159736 RepID=UPI0030C88966